MSSASTALKILSLTDVGRPRPNAKTGRSHDFEALREGFSD
jgi:hypothetical protein